MTSTNVLPGNWPYPLTEVTSDRRVPRPGVQRGFAAELTGVDGSLRGGLRPFAGFKRIYELDFFADENHDETSVVLDFFPVTLRVEADTFAFGFVYRAQRLNGGAEADVFLDWYDRGQGIWRVGNLLSSGVSLTAQMHVEVYGRLGYVFLAGESPVLFYVREDDAGDQELVTLGETGVPPFPGPGKRPTCLSPEEAGALGSLTNTGDVERPGAAQVILTEEGPGDSGIYPDPPVGVGVPPGRLQQQVFRQAESVNQLVFEDIQVGSTGNPETLVVALYGIDDTDVGFTPTSVTWQAEGGLPEAAVLVVESGGAPVADRHGASVWVLAADDNTDGIGDVTVTWGDVRTRVAGMVLVFSGLDQATPVAGSATSGPVSDQDTVGINYTATTDNLVVTAGGMRVLLSSQTGTVNAPQTVLWSEKLGSGNIKLEAFVGGHYTEPGPVPVPVDFEQQVVPIVGGQVPDQVVCLVEFTTVVDGPVAEPTACADTGLLPGVGTTSIVALSPEDDATNVGVEATLFWRVENTLQPVPPQKYHVFFWEPAVTADPVFTANELGGGTYPHPALAVVCTGKTSFKPGTLYPAGRLPFGRTFRWQIVVSEGMGINTTPPQFVGPVFEFTTSGEFNSRKLEPGDYSFAYYLFDSQTGRQSALSKIAQAREVDFGEDELFAVMEIVYDSAKFDQAFIFRSVRVQDAGGTFIAGILQLDNIITLATFHTVNNGAGTIFPDTQDFRQAAYWYQLEDKQLANQLVFQDQVLYDERMPSGGAAILYDGSMLVSSIRGDTASTTEESRPQDPFNSLGEIRWSAARLLSPELFPPINRYVPNIPSNEVIRFERLGGNVIGFSRDRMYHIRREAGSIRPSEMHGGFGAVNHRALDVVGSSIYFVTRKGVKVVDAFGRLEDMKVWDDLIIEDWGSTITSVSVAFDPGISTLIILNSGREEAALTWFNTGMTTQLRDMVFREVRRGSWPQDLNDLDSDLIERAMFLQNSPKDQDDEVLAQWRPRIYVADYPRSKLTTGTLGGQSNGEPAVRLLDVEGDAVFRFAAWDEDAVPQTRIRLFLASGSPAGGTYVHGAYLYLMRSDQAPELEGTKVKIKRLVGVFGPEFEFEVSDADVGKWLAVNGDQDAFVALSPVYFRWVGYPVALLSEEGVMFGGVDFHRLKQVNGMGASFTDVTEDPPWTVVPQEHVRFRGLVFEGNDDVEKAAEYPRALDGSEVRSVSEHESIYWAALGRDTTLTGRYGVIGVSLSPGLETFLPDVDFRLLSVLVQGNILKGHRSERPT